MALDEATLRFTIFISILLLMMLWEWLAPKRRLTQPHTLRWGSNFGLALLNTVLLRLLVPSATLGAAEWALANNWGLLAWLDLPFALLLIISLLLLDVLIYGQHVLVHHVPLLWRLHRVHHADTDFDVSTGVRFHPLEILFSMGIKLAAVVLLGVPPLAAMIFEIVLSATSLFNHSNIYLPAKIDRLLRWVIVTPDMHRVHHSIVMRETNSNFGFNLPWWDYLFRTYRAQPAAGHDTMTIGIEQFRDSADQRLPRLLMQPFDQASPRAG